MTDNLATSLVQEGEHPWAFNKWMRHMAGVRPGAYVAFVHMERPGGAPVGRNGPYPPEALCSRLVLGKVTKACSNTARPFFDGFPEEFWFDLLADEVWDPPRDLLAMSDELNGRLEGLGLTAASLHEVLSNGRSAKIGMFFEGQPRKANYFATEEHPDAKAAKTAVATPPSPAKPNLASPLKKAADEFVEAVHNCGLRFAGINAQLPRAFIAALATKRFVLLTGLAGSGKTQLARAFGGWLGSDDDGPRYLVVPVRPDWTTPDPLLGFEDALLPPDDGRRAWTVPSALEFMLRAHDDPEHLYLLVLDEMNLAHVERYFADVLSGMESAEPVLPNLERSSSGHWYPRVGELGTVPIPRNLLIVGTVNIDETTYQFSPKVLDRSFTFEFRVSASELDGALEHLQPVEPASSASLEVVRSVVLDPDWHLAHPAPNQVELEEELAGFHEHLAAIGLEFGHRSYREALRFAAVLAGAGLDDDDELTDFVVMAKILPRVHGSRRELEPFLAWLGEVAADAEGRPRLPLVARKSARMLHLARTNQYAGFAE